jgi:hypothetical protein
MRRAAGTTRGSAEYTPSTSEQILRRERRSHRYCRCIASATAEGRDFPSIRNTLESGDDNDLAARELVLHPERPHFDDARIDMAIVGDNARLAAGEADRIAAKLADRHGKERHGDALAGREQHVQFAPVRVGRHLLGHREEIVRRVAHRGHDNDDVVRLASRAHDALGDTFELLHVGYAAAAILLNDDGHG